MVLYTYVFSGADVEKVFNNEIGTHSWQRVPPTERRGRVHTSSIKVVLLEVGNYVPIEIHPSEIRIETIRGSGNGGQHKNVTDSCVVMTHLSTGIRVVSDSRSQHSNKKNALRELTERVNHLYRTGHLMSEHEAKKEQLSEASRGDKRRTYKVTESMVIDHITGKRARLKDIFRGKINLLK